MKCARGFARFLGSELKTLSGYQPGIAEEYVEHRVRDATGGSRSESRAAVRRLHGELPPSPGGAMGRLGGVSQKTCLLDYF